MISFLKKKKYSHNWGKKGTWSKDFTSQSKLKQKKEPVKIEPRGFHFTIIDVIRFFKEKVKRFKKLKGLI